MSSECDRTAKVDSPELDQPREAAAEPGNDANPISLHQFMTHDFHEDNIYNERQNYFLTAQSMLMVAFSFLSQRENQIGARAICALGIILTVIWIYVNARQWYIITYLREVAAKSHASYVRMFERRKTWPVSSITLLSYVVPSVVLAAWAAFLASVIVPSPTQPRNNPEIRVEIKKKDLEDLLNSQGRLVIELSSGKVTASKAR